MGLGFRVQGLGFALLRFLLKDFNSETISTCILVRGFLFKWALGFGV